MSLEFAILGFLAERPRSGYDLKNRCFDGPISSFWTADQAQIYRTLDRLSRGKAVRSQRKRQAGRPDRRVFELTPAGLEELDAWRTARHPLPPLRDPLLVQLWFAGDVDDPELVSVLTEARDGHQERLDGLRERVKELSRDQMPARHAAVRRIALDGAIAGERAAIDWLDDAIETARDGMPGGGRRGSSQRPLFG